MTLATESSELSSDDIIDAGRLTSYVNLATESSEFSADDIIDAGSAFQSLKVSGKKLFL